jgi:hypothetical protein
MFRTVALLLTSLLILAPCSTVQAEDNPGQKAVLVTGASSGLGRSMTEMMAAQGYFVYAGAPDHRIPRQDRDHRFDLGSPFIVHLGALRDEQTRDGSLW